MLPTPKQVLQWSSAADVLLRRSSVHILFSETASEMNAHFIWRIDPFTDRNIDTEVLTELLCCAFKCYLSTKLIVRQDVTSRAHHSFLGELESEDINQFQLLQEINLFSVDEAYTALFCK